ncbi:MAG: DmsC/YnfH family molybdoenzyme membrane anchor subunit, partial [Janthinobacterium lividum]
MALPLHERAVDGQSPALVRLTENGLVFDRIDSGPASTVEVKTSLIPSRKPAEGEQYRFHFNMTKCIGCRSCEVACNEQNGNPAEINWRRIGELEGGTWPNTQRSYLSMGCNHCLSADCLRGCPVDAYTKDPLTGIVLHSADACIGCQYCVWNCPYSVPQFNPERGVVGKCDMCKGRLDEGLEPACVDSCPEGAIEIELVNMLDWRANYDTADSPGMPAAEQTLSTTRITLPTGNGSAPPVTLERVDAGQVQPEHAHMSLVYMTTLMQAVAGALAVLTLTGGLDPVRLFLLFTLTAGALQGSTMHLGRPAFAYRALKMWRRSWLSREVLLFTLFFLALTAATAASVFVACGHALPLGLLRTLDWAASVLGIAGTVASAMIYLVQARPSWNLKHTPVDFVVTAAMLGGLLTAAFNAAASFVT